MSTGVKEKEKEDLSFESIEAILLYLPQYVCWTIISKVLRPGLSPRMRARSRILYFFGYYAWCSSGVPH